MYLYYRGPILAFSLSLLTTYMYGMNQGNGGASTASHIIDVRESMNSSSSSDDRSPVGLFHINAPQHIDGISDLPVPGDDDSDEAPLTAHQMAQQYLSHFDGNTTAALPHLVAALQANEKAKCNLGRCMHTVTRGGIQPLFVKHEDLIHIKTPRGPTRNFMGNMSSAMPIAHELVDPVVQALAGTSEKLQTTEQEKADLTQAHQQLKVQSKFWAVISAFVGSALTGGVAVGLTFLGNYVDSLHPTAPQAIQCVLTLANATMGG